MKIVPSPIQLSRIRDLSAQNNIDTVQLKDILGDPLIKECWQFNYLFDLDFLMGSFDEDIGHLVQVRVMHGSWKKEDHHRVMLEESAKQYKNLRLITAYMPEPFGTHHSKMMILLRHDDCAQVVIHTANMIPQDWTNMCQAVWRSPLLPLFPGHAAKENSTSSSGQIGSGVRFKNDLLAYLRAYGKAKTGSLTAQLGKYDFSGVKAALVASTPCKQKPAQIDSKDEPLWGWPGLERVLKHVPVSSRSNDSGPPHIIVQVSSIASLGQTDRYLKETFFPTLATTGPRTKDQRSRKPKFSVIFPTADEIRRSLDGYQSGSSIHMKIQTAAQAKQVAYMKPYLSHWAGDGDHLSRSNPELVRDAGRRRAAPHIKTYIRFSDSSAKQIDWAMITSANMSTQAWGSAINATGEVRICSWEIGVVVWPELFSQSPSSSSSDQGSESGTSIMVPVFKQDAPNLDTVNEFLSSDEKSVSQSKDTNVIGFRMPYNLPLVPYRPIDMPWCATSSYAEPDWMGRSYNVSYD
ncbi:tyrosyl-DNA phosphodiesterase 1 [Xylona heveae TC161]|uniref:Tyrosyl-DNA phosphodiesterase 1 n=1 Tax=Xylona heveae (strain CBS 132557 / TC161) TaxID=1328760 RepID=A0A165ITY5_XYLHT|nr:tyrosyl-DNA phosphodiesterase 1 [Xylona heveae TC161]KZF25388.1 tyrosyl-DNA phosphodiesterase 1 [Xylona heveae TC161]